MNAAISGGDVRVVPDVAEPVITARAQLRSSSGARSRDPLAHPAAWRDRSGQLTIHAALSRHDG
jgi:hypothetical protein